MFHFGYFSLEERDIVMVLKEAKDSLSRMTWEQDNPEHVGEGESYIQQGP